MITPKSQSVGLSKEAEWLRCTGGAARFLCAYCGRFLGCCFLFCGILRSKRSQGQERVVMLKAFVASWRAATRFEGLGCLRRF